MPDRFVLNRYLKHSVLATGCQLLAAQIANRLEQTSRPAVLVPIMVGALPVLGEVLRALPQTDLDLRVEPMRLRSYGEAESPGELKFDYCPKADVLQGRLVFLLDDIFDRGQTMLAAERWCKEVGKADTVVSMALLRRHGEAAPDSSTHACVTAIAVPSDAFLVGFGLDYKGRMRHLTSLYKLDRMPSEQFFAIKRLQEKLQHGEIIDLYDGV